MSALTVLKDRGIDSACQDANWQPYIYSGSDGWRYPLYNSAGDYLQNEDGIIYRWKNANSSGLPKYAWIPGKVDKARYYLLPDTLSAIKSAGGKCYLASGEPDVMAYRAAGIKNVICWFGESSVPATLREDLEYMNINWLVCYPDRDKTGMTMASKVHALLDGGDIIFAAYALTPELESKTDINTLWQQVNYDRHVFEQRLSDCTPIETADLELWQRKDDAPKAAQPSGATYDGELPQEFINAIIADVESRGVRKWKSDGWSEPFCCPFHKDEKPSSNFNRDSMSFKCFTCDMSTNAKTYGEQVGIHLRDYLPQRDISAPPLTVLPKPENASADVQVITPLYEDGYEVTENLIAELKGERLSDANPMAFPFTSFHKLGGFAEMMWTGKLVYVSGVSGGGKTSLAETMYEHIIRNGDDIVWFGPEWNAEEMKLRALQRAGGLNMTEIAKYRAWKADEAKGIPMASRRGVNYPTARVNQSIDLLQNMLSWTGRPYFLKPDSRLDSMNAITDTIESIVESKRAKGRKVSTLFFDYLQRAPQARSGWDSQEKVVSQIKSVCERLDLFGWVLVQPTKGDSKSTRDGAALTEASGQGISDQQANLYMTLTPAFDDSGNKLPYICANVVKNSMGRTGKVFLKWSYQNLCMIDEEVDPRFFQKDFKTEDLDDIPEI